LRFVTRRSWFRKRGAGRKIAGLGRIWAESPMW
jgi:hypothetical protein